MYFYTKCIFLAPVHLRILDKTRKETSIDLLREREIEGKKEKERERKRRKYILN